MSIVGVAFAAVVLGVALSAISGSPRAGRESDPVVVAPVTSVAQKLESKRTCRRRTVSSGYAAAVARATASRRDVWGEELLSAPGGPTYEAARRFLSPVLYGQQRQHRPLTPSGVYYLAFAYPLNAQSGPVYALHVADGSQIITRRIGPWSPSITIKVGPHGHENYGACLAWLTPATLAEGYLPILRTSYVDANGVRYRQESFLGRVKGFRPLVSLVRLSIDARPSRASAVVRFLPSQKALVRHGDRLDTTAGTALIASDGATYDGRAFRFRVAQGDQKTVYLAWVLGTGRDPEGEGRPGDLRGDAGERRELLAQAARGRRAVLGTRGPRSGCAARDADPADRVLVEVQRGQSVRRALVRRRNRHRRGHVPLRLSGCRPRYPRLLASAASPPFHLVARG